MRSAAREATYKVIFSYLFTGEWDNDFKTKMYLESKLLDEDVAFADTIIEYLRRNFNTLIDEIAGLSKGYKIDRIYPADKAAMLLAISEMNAFGDIPAAVTINEAVGLAGKFSTENSLSFVNGILGSYYAKIKEGK